MRHLVIGSVGLLLLSCATVDTIKSEVVERIPYRNKTTAVDKGSVENETEKQAPALTEKQQLIAEIQEGLKNLGYSTGTVNGRLSAKTEAAIQDFQLDNGLRIDGKPTKKLLSLIQSRMKAKNIAS